MRHDKVVTGVSRQPVNQKVFMRTVGVEEELLLVDAVSGRPRSVAAQVLQAASASSPVARDAVGGSLKHELQQEQLEGDTTPQTEMSALELELRSWRDRAGSAAREAGARVLASGTSPIHAEPHLVPTTRYRKLAERYGLTASEQLICGCHVHVAVESDEEAIGVLDRIRVWLPSLLALSANSPFWKGEDSGYASFRTQVQGRWPVSGPADVFGTAGHYLSRVADMIASGVVLDAGMLYLDARPSHHYPTVEIRSPDVCVDVRDTVLIAALCRGLVETSACRWTADEPPEPVPTALLRLATWQAARFGIGDNLLDPQTSRPRPAREVIGKLIDHVRPALRGTEDEALVETRVEMVFSRGSGATRQRAVLEKTGQMTDVVADLVRVTAGLEE
jgi:glutamate---cysteine ligase / carboxylate-amine ligase